MAVALLKHHALSFKNRFVHRGHVHRSVKRDVGVGIISVLMMYGVYSVMHSFLLRVSADGEFGVMLTERFLSLTLWGFFVMLLLSNFVSALGSFFSGKDLELLLTLPISAPRLFTARLIETLFNSSWMFLFFLLPAMVAYTHALQLPWAFLGLSAVLIVPLTVIPAAIGVAGVILLVNLVPAYRMKELITFVACVSVVAFAVVGMRMPPSVSQESAQVRDFVYTLAVMKNPVPIWSPTVWASELLLNFLSGPKDPVLAPSLLLVATMCGTFAFAYLLFDLFFVRGWNLSHQSGRGHKLHGTLGGSRLAHTMFPFAPQVRALMYKELRTFIRDATQSLQLLFLLMLTFIYLYNFRALQSVANLNGAIQHWWDLALCLSNIILGTCIVAAIATRFVFPSISLEGRGYTVLRAAPLSLSGMLWSKFFIWIIPITVVAITLLVSGAWAIGVPQTSVALCAIFSTALSIGLVGTGVGIGAVYARFDWDSPTEVAASFGSLVFMFAALLLLFITLIPISLLLACSTIPSIVEYAASPAYLVVFGSGLLLTFGINVLAAQRAIRVGAQSLLERER